MTITNPIDDISFADYDKKKYCAQIYGFDCGDQNINKFLTEAARHVCTTKLVFIRGKLAAFVSYNCCSFEEIINDDTSSLEVENVPAIEIKVYAVDSKFQHERCLVSMGNDKFEKFSHFIFSYYLLMLKEIAKNYIAASYFIVFSKKEKSSFLEKQGFKAMIDNFQPHVNKFEKNCTPMFAKIPKF